MEPSRTRVAAELHRTLVCSRRAFAQSNAATGAGATGSRAAQSASDDFQQGLACTEPVSSFYASTTATSKRLPSSYPLSSLSLVVLLLVAAPDALPHRCNYLPAPSLCSASRMKRRLNVRATNSGLDERETRAWKQDGGQLDRERLL